MKNITLKSSTLVHPLFFVALNALQAKELPVHHMKQIRRIVKKLRDELKEIQEDTDIIIRDVFGAEFQKQEIITLIRADESKLKETMEELKFPPEKQKDYLDRLSKFHEKTKQLGDEEVNVPFPKVVLPENFEFRTDYGTILEDVIDLE